MAFQVIMEQNNSEPEKMDKEIENIATLNGTLRESTSIINPNILVECGINIAARCNYITIPTFNRSYFVRNFTSFRDGLFIFDCHCDVLSSFKDGIRSNNAIIRRQENLWNLYLNDGSFKVYQNPSVLTKSFPNGFSAHEIVLAVAGK